METQNRGGRDASAIEGGASASALCSSNASTTGDRDSGATPPGRKTATIGQHERLEATASLERGRLEPVLFSQRARFGMTGSGESVNVCGMWKYGYMGGYRRRQ